EHAVRLDVHAIAEGAVGDDGALLDDAVGADLDLAAQLDAGPERGVAADLDAGLDVEPLGIAHRHAGAHERLGEAQADDAIGLGDVDAVVAAHDLVGRSADGDHGQLACGALHDVGEVDFALRVVGADRAQRVEEEARRAAVDAGVDLVDALFFDGGVLLLDDAHELAAAVADDAAVAARSEEHTSELQSRSDLVCRL